MKIGFFLSGFPIFSETFVSNEVVQLQKHIAGSIWFETGNKIKKVQPSVKKIKWKKYQIPMVILSQNNFLNILRSHFHWLIKFPFRYFGLMAIFLNKISGKNFSKIESFKIFLKSPLIASQIIEEKCELIYVHETDRAFLYALFTQQLTKLPFGIIFHTYYLFYKNKLLKEKIKTADFTIFQSKYSQKYALKKIQVSKIRNSFVISSPGIDTSYFSPSKKAKTKKVLQKKARKIKIISVGRLEEDKGHKHLVKAIYNLKDTTPNISLNIVGYGSLEKGLKNLIKKLKLEKNVSLLGAIGHNKKFIKLLRKSDVFILPSIIDKNEQRDVHPNAIKEAMSAGVITVASDLGGIKEFIKHGKNGFLVKPGNVNQLEEIIVKITKLKTKEKNAIEKNARTTISSLYEKKHITKNLLKVFYTYKND